MIYLMKNKYKNITEEILELAGVAINGYNPLDIRVNNDEFYRRAILKQLLHQETYECCFKF